MARSSGALEGDMFGARVSLPRSTGIAALVALPVLIALGVLLPPAAAGQPGASIEVTIDTPEAGAVVTNGQAVTIGGWVVDHASRLGPGIASIAITVAGPGGGIPQPVDVVVGTSRPDVAQQFGRPDWTQSGFTASWTPDGLPAGPHTVAVAARATHGGGNARAVPVAVAGPPVAPQPVGPVLAPQAGQLAAPQAAAPPPPRPPAAPRLPVAAPGVPRPPPPCSFSPYDPAPPCPR